MFIWSLQHGKVWHLKSGETLPERSFQFHSQMLFPTHIFWAVIYIMERPLINPHSALTPLVLINDDAHKHLLLR